MASNVGNIKVKLNLDSAAYEYGLKACVNSTKTLGTALAGLGIGISTVKIIEFGKSVRDASVRMDGLINKFNAAASSEAVGAESLRFVREESKRLGLAFIDTADAFGGFEAATLRSGLTLEQTKKIFTNVSEAVVSLHLSSERTSLVFRALEQMASKGVVSMEELRRQLGDSLPGAFEIAAKSMGVTTSKFNEMVSNGEVLSADFLPKFADAIKQELGQSSELAATQANASFNRLGNAIYDIQETIGESLNPVLAKTAEEITSLLDSTNATIEKMQEWAAVNQRIVGGLKDAAVAIAALAVGIPLTNAAVVTIIASMRSFGTVTAKTTAYQIAFATLLKGDSALALIQYRAALAGTIVQIKALTVAMLSCPLTWVTLALGAGAAAWWAYQQSAKRTVRVIDELNNAQQEQVNKTSDAIRTLKELQKAKNLDYNQTKRLDAAIAYLTEKYPNYIGKLQEELKLKGKISKATAEQIANEMMLSKVKGLTEERLKVNKDIKRDLFLSQFRPGAIHAGGRYGLTKATQRKDDALNAQKAQLEKERQSIINELTALEKDTDSPSMSTAGRIDEKAAKKAAAEAKKRQKEALDLKIAQLEQQKYIVERTDEEIFEIELKQAEARLAATKKGTSEHAEALAQKLKLEQDHAKKVREVQQSFLVQQIEADKQNIDAKISNLELQRSAYQISKRQQLEGEIALIHERIALEKKSLEEQLKLMKNNEIEKVKLRRDSTRTQVQLTQELTRKNVELKTYELEKFKSFTDGMTSSFSSSFSSMLKGEQTFSEACLSLLDSLVDNFIDSVVNMTSEWVTQKMLQIAYNSIFATSTTATNATVAASNGLVAASNTATAGSAGMLSAANAVLTTSNATVAASAGTAAATTAASAGVMAGASATMAGGVTALISPVTSLAGAFFSLATASAICAVTLPVIALSTTIISLSAALAALSLGLMNATMMLTATTSMLFAPISVMLTAEFAVIGAAATVAAKAVATLAIALAAASAAAIPLVGWAIAPGAALATGAAIMAADSLVQFREKGGPVEAGKPYIVGEKRPELFIPDRSGTILPDTSALNGGGGTTNQYSISVSMPISATDAKSFESRIDEFTNRIHSNLSKGIRKRKLTPLTT